MQKFTLKIDKYCTLKMFLKVNNSGEIDIILNSELINWVFIILCFVFAICHVCIIWKWFFTCNWFHTM